MLDNISRGLGAIGVGHPANETLVLDQAVAVAHAVQRTKVLCIKQ